jgi:hypothetical protein
MAYIDMIAADAVYALRSRDAAAATAMMLTFHARFCGLENGHHAPSPHECTGMTLRDNGFVISFGDKHLHYSRAGNKDRWCVGESESDLPNAFDRHDIAVSRFGAPFAFLEGIEYCIKCYTQATAIAEMRIVHEEFIRQQSDLEKLSTAIAYSLRVKAEIEDKIRLAEQEIFAEPFVSGCLKKAATAAEQATDLPEPPIDTVSPDVARRIFKGVSGVYFLWDGASIVYVGRANCIGSRLSPSHHRLNQGHMISVVQMSRSDSWAAEPYYIWRYRPPLNKEIHNSISEQGFEERQGRDYIAAWSKVAEIPIGVTLKKGAQASAH